MASAQPGYIGAEASTHIRRDISQIYNSEKIKSLFLCLFPYLVHVSEAAFFSRRKTIFSMVLFISFVLCQRGIAVRFQQSPRSSSTLPRGQSPPSPRTREGEGEQVRNFTLKRDKNQHMFMHKKLVTGSSYKNFRFHDCTHNCYKVSKVFFQPVGHSFRPP